MSSELSRSPKRHRVIDPNDVRNRVQGPECFQTVNRRIHGFRRNSPHLIELEPLIVSGGEKGNGFTLAKNEFLPDKIRGLLDSSKSDNGLNGEKEPFHDVHAFCPFPGFACLQMVPAGYVFDEPFGRKTILRVLERVVHLNVGSAEKVIVPLFHRVFDRDDPLFFLVGVDSFAFAPTATVFIGAAIQPFNNGWSADVQLTGDLGVIPALLGKSERCLKIF